MTVTAASATSALSSALSLRITRIESIPVALPPQRLYRISQGADETGQFVLVRVETDAGLDGWGEANPQVFFSGDSVESVKATIDHYLAPALLGANPLAIEAAVRTMDAAVKHQPYAKAAVEFALWDVAGKALGLPVHALLGGPVRDQVAANQGIGISTPEDMAQQALAAVEAGFGVVKLKVGLDPRQDLVNVRAVREAIGDRASIRVDANQAYPTERAIKLLRRMDEAVDLELVEQPVAAWDLEGMARVCDALDVPILADESLFGLEDAVRLVRTGAADLFNIKTQKMGGLLRSRQVAAVAEGAGIGCLVGSMGESGPGKAADLHFAAATAAITYPSAFGHHPRVASIISQPIVARGGFVQLLSAPGLGVDIDQQVLARARLDR